MAIYELDAARDLTAKGLHAHGVQNADPYGADLPEALVAELAEKLVDLQDYVRRWRFNHVTTVERTIGKKRGTGGTGGGSYLHKMLHLRLFPELWSVRTRL